MKIKCLKCRGFKSITDDVVIDFDQVNGLCKIVGPVGSGKTTIGEAILYGLYGQIKGKNLADLINLSERELFVEISVESKGHTLIIKRGMKLSKAGKMSNTAFDVTSDGEPIVFSNKKEAQTILENEYYDTNKLSVELLCIISFNNFRSLLSMSAKERTDFVNHIFGLNMLQVLADKVKSSLKSEQSKLNGYKNDSDSFTKCIETLNDVVDDYTVDIDASRESYKKLQIRKDALEAARSTETTPLNDRIRVLSDRYTATNKEQIECVTEGKLVGSQLKLFEKGCCPTCGQKAPAGLITDLSDKKEKLAEIYRTTQSMLRAIEADKNTCQSELNEIYNRYSSEIDAIKNDMLNITSTVNAYKRNVEQLKKKEQTVKEYNENIKTLNDQIKNANISIDKHQRIYDILTNDIKKNILGSFIPAINRSIANYSRKIGLPFSISFDDMFEPVIMNTTFATEVPLSTLSTGQAKAVDTCIILGVIDSLISRINFNVTFFDELMSNMDAEMRDNICKVLKETIRKDQVIFIINHADLNDEYFAHSIQVENKGGSKYIFK